MVPGILAILVTMIGGFLAAFNIVKEKEVGTIEQINVTPIKKHHFILGKLIPFWISGECCFYARVYWYHGLCMVLLPPGVLWYLYQFHNIVFAGSSWVWVAVSTFCDASNRQCSSCFFYDDFYFNGWSLYIN